MKSCPLIPSQWELPQVLRVRLGSGPGRQRAMLHDGHLLLVLHDVPRRRTYIRDAQLFWRNPEGKWRSTLAVGGEVAVDEHLKSFAGTIDRLAESFDDADESEEFFEILRSLGPLRRTIRNLQAALQNAREILSDDLTIIDWRDKAYELVRRAELLYSDVHTALEFETAHQAKIQAEASRQRAVAAHRLNVLVAFFFPIATLSSILSMNLHHGLEEWETPRAPWVLLAVLVISVLLGALLSRLITRPARAPHRDAKQGKDGFAE